MIYEAVVRSTVKQRYLVDADSEDLARYKLKTFADITDKPQTNGLQGRSFILDRFVETIKVVEMDNVL